MNSVNCKFWLQSQSELLAVMNTGLNPYQAETDLINTVAYQFLNNDLVYICKWSIRCGAISQSEKSGSPDLHCKWFKIDKGIMKTLFHSLNHTLVTLCQQ